jgi:hypothetical protein
VAFKVPFSSLLNVFINNVFVGIFGPYMMLWKNALVRTS